jgi:hypothetical protein
MKKKFLLLFSLLILIFSCTKENNGDKNIGNWKRIDKKEFIEVAQAGQKGYFLTYYTIYVDGYKKSYYCEYKDGCYIRKTDDDEIPIFCENGKRMLDSNGNLYIKK